MVPPISSPRLRREIADSQWWDTVTKVITHSSAYSEEYVISESVVDAIDFVESDHVEEWEEPIYAVLTGDALHCSRESKSFFDLTPVVNALGFSSKRVTTSLSPMSSMRRDPHEVV